MTGEGIWHYEELEYGGKQYEFAVRGADVQEAEFIGLTAAIVRLNALEADRDLLERAMQVLENASRAYHVVSDLHLLPVVTGRARPSWDDCPLSACADDRALLAEWRARKQPEPVAGKEEVKG